MELFTGVHSIKHLIIKIWRSDEIAFTEAWGCLCAGLSCRALYLAGEPLAAKKAAFASCVP